MEHREVSMGMGMSIDRLAEEFTGSSRHTCSACIFAVDEEHSVPWEEPGVVSLLVVNTITSAGLVHVCL